MDGDCGDVVETGGTAGYLTTEIQRKHREHRDFVLGDENM